MSESKLSWIAERPSRWDADKERVVGSAGAERFGEKTVAAWRTAEVLPGDWWHVESDGRVVGYGWMDVTWGDAEILVAVDASERGKGVGTFILDRLEAEARSRGLNYLQNVVAVTHPEGDAVQRWLEGRRFVRDDDGRLRRSVVGP
jgi:GNAT superfamily N-acetyltransferase